MYTSSGQGEVYREVHLDLYAVTTDEAHLSYGIWECDRTTFECVSIETGDGPLYGDEVSTSQGRITVNINTAENPEFSSWAGSGGPINITWTKLSGWSSRYITQARYRTGDYTSHSHGTFTTTGAFAEGSVIGVQLEPEAALRRWGPSRMAESRSCESPDAQVSLLDPCHARVAPRLSPIRRP